ncbi:hypothetical protein GCM10009839_22470 [Catenulispora yoronensis]|uniref:HEAT repeat domain-containing protein n=2 Tax=Catenulispora yoronensis TaxID=450799 RepID=A0ABN2TY72_9ACTN
MLAYEAVRAGVPGMRQLLADEDPYVRAATAYLLAWFPEDSADSVTALTALLRRESDSGVVINALIALGLLPGAPTATIAPYLSSDDDPIAWAAAAALVAADAVDATVIERLGAALGSDSSNKTGLLYRYGEFSRCASKCLAAITGDLVPLAIDTTIDAFSESSLTQMWAAAPAAIALAFQGTAPAHEPAFAELNPYQKRALRALVAAGPRPWRQNNKLGLLLKPLRVPHIYNDLRAYVESGVSMEAGRA